MFFFLGARRAMEGAVSKKGHVLEIDFRFVIVEGVAVARVKKDLLAHLQASYADCEVTVALEEDQNGLLVKIKFSGGRGRIESFQSYFDLLVDHRDELEGWELCTDVTPVEIPEVPAVA